MNWLEVLPAFGVVVTLMGVGIKAGMVLKTLEHAVKDIEEIKKDIKEIKMELKEHDKRMNVLENTS